MATVSIVHRLDKKNKKGEAPIHFRIIKDRKIRYISTGVMLFPALWDKENKRVKTKHKNSARLTRFITNKFSELQGQVLDHETGTKSLTTRQLKEKIYGKKPTAFFPYAENTSQEYLKAGKIGTYDLSQSIIKKLQEYTKNTSLDFQDITPSFLLNYEKYLRSKLRNQTNTIHKDFKFIRRCFNAAIVEELIEVQDYPFRKYKMKTEKVKKTYLTQDELEKIISHKCTPGTRLDLHRDMFVFAAYTGGLRVSDVLLLRWKNFNGTHIDFDIRKTDGQLSIKLPNKALEIINKYKPENFVSSSFIFPMLSNDLDMKDLMAVDNAISTATAYINKNLKVIAEKAKLEKKISFHISRHTWATQALRKGISIDKVSRLMGHANIRETQIYAKIVSEELDKAMDAFND